MGDYTNNDPQTCYANGFEEGEARGLERGIAAGRLLYMSEVVRIIEGATRNDLAKVTAYAELLAGKLEQDGEAATAERVRKVAKGEAGARIYPAVVDAASVAGLSCECPWTPPTYPVYRDTRHLPGCRFYDMEIARQNK